MFFSIILIRIAKGNVQENITLHKKKRFFSIILIEIAKVNVQENITQHIKTFFVHNFDLNRNNKCTRKYNTTKKTFLFSIILIEMKKQMYKKILHNKKKLF